MCCSRRSLPAWRRVRPVLGVGWLALLRRLIVVRQRPSGVDIRVQIVGVQYADGRVERRIAVHEVDHDEPITPLEAQQLAAVIAAAADELGRLSADS
jgi:hypothetical protein